MLTLNLIDSGGIFVKEIKNRVEPNYIIQATSLEK